MSRVTKSNTAKSKHKKILASNKGYYGARSRLYKTAKQAHIKSLQYSFRDRKNKKRNFRSLWITRINAASRNIGIPYSRLIRDLDNKNIIIDRKILSELSVNDKPTFEKVVKLATS